MPTPVHTPRPVFPELNRIPDWAQMRFYERGARYLLDGKVIAWTGPCRDVPSPVSVARGSSLEKHIVGRYPLMTEKDALAALDAAVRAYGKGCGAWPTLPVAERIRAVERFIPRMEAVRDEVVRLLMWEIGKTAADSRKEFDRTVEYMRATIEALKEVDRAGGRFAVEEGFIAMIRRSPLGVVLCMGPYNYPLNETFTTLIPALIMGNTVVVKPPRYGVLVYGALLEAFAESFPPGVVNTVFGEGSVVVGPIVKSGAVDVLAFIGSAKVGSILKHQHPRPNRLRCVLGLGAKNAAVVLSDADLDLAVRECVLGGFSFNGQRCTAIKAIFVHRKVADAFCQKFAAAVENLVAGMPWEDGVAITPLPEEGKAEWLAGLVREAREGGASVINRGGGTIDGTLFYPAVVYPATPAMQMAQVEQFGPVTPILPFDDEREFLDWIVESPVGQQAALFGHDPEALSRLIDPLVNQVCRVNLNSQCQRGPDRFPFGGRKDSAEGTLSVSDALRAFSIRSLVAAKSTEANQKVISSIVSGRHSSFLTTDFIF